MFPRATFPAFKGLFRNCRGAAAVEAAICLPVLMVALLGIIDFGRALWAQNALHYSVEEAARCGVVNAASTCNSPSATASFAAGRSGLPVASTVFTATPNSTCGSEAGYQVSASYALPLFTPLFPSITLQAQSCFPT